MAWVMRNLFIDDAPGERRNLAAAEPSIGDALPDPRSIAREVRACLEETLVLLTEALPAEHR